MIDDLIRKFLMLHPDTPIDNTEYALPLRGVKQLVGAAVAAEREACAKVCEQHADVYKNLPASSDAAWAACIDLLDAIRARR